MAKTYRELLMFAAKAIGLNIAQGSEIAIDGKVWNPRDEDGDSFGLMVKLNLAVNVGVIGLRVIDIWLPAVFGWYVRNIREFSIMCKH